MDDNMIEYCAVFIKNTGGIITLECHRKTLKRYWNGEDTLSVQNIEHRTEIILTK